MAAALPYLIGNALLVFNGLNPCLVAAAIPHAVRLSDLWSWISLTRTR